MAVIELSNEISMGNLEGLNNLQNVWKLFYKIKNSISFVWKKNTRNEFFGND